MGEVYKARDMRLGRDVALKTLPADLAANPERLERFERESRAASVLSDPHILAILDVGADRGISFFVAEGTRRALSLDRDLARDLRMAQDRRSDAKAIAGEISLPGPEAGHRKRAVWT